MQFSSSLILLCTAALAAAAVKDPKVVGCYTDLTSTTSTSDMYNSRGLCHTFCHATASHFAVKGMECLCLDALPEAAKKTDDKKCDVSCPGYPDDKCGGKTGQYSVYSTATNGTAAAHGNSTSNTTIPQQPQGGDADSAAGRNVASLAAAVMVAAGLAML